MGMIMSSQLGGIWTSAILKHYLRRKITEIDKSVYTLMVSTQTADMQNAIIVMQHLSKSDWCQS